MYKSTDDGMTWSVVFSVPDINSVVMQATKVSSDQYSDIFWTIESKSFVSLEQENTQLMYMNTSNKTADNAIRDVTCSDVAMPTHIQKDGSVYLMSYDGHSTIFALVDNNRDVFMWSVNGMFNGQLHLLFDNSHNLFYSNFLSVVCVNQTMYVFFRLMI